MFQCYLVSLVLGFKVRVSLLHLQTIEPLDYQYTIMDLPLLLHYCDVTTVMAVYRLT